MSPEMRRTQILPFHLRTRNATERRRFRQSFALRVEADDAIALLRMTTISSTLLRFDVKTLQAITSPEQSVELRVKTVGQIRNRKRSMTRLVIADTKIHIRGNFGNIKIARDAVVALIRGNPVKFMPI